MLKFMKIEENSDYVIYDYFPEGKSEKGTNEVDDSHLDEGPLTKEWTDDGINYGKLVEYCIENSIDISTVDEEFVQRFKEK